MNAHARKHLEALEKREKEARKAEIGARMDELQAKRAEARARRDFATADAIRAEIEAAGFVVADAKLPPK